MTRMSQRSRNAALKFANEVRGRMGKRPVTRIAKGKPRQAAQCAIARTIDRNGRVQVLDFGGYGSARYAKAAFTHPKTGQQVVVSGGAMVVDFIHAFDAGAAPDLIQQP